MSILPAQIEHLKAAIALGLHSLRKPPMMTAVEYADNHFYMSSESSYMEGRWETLPFQVAILNAMGNDQIQTVNVMKSARVGYTKLLMANMAYKIEHKKRNLILWQPTDGQAAGFMKAHVESAIRDIPVWLAIAPWYGRKHRDSTLDTKRFANGKQLWVRGGKAAKNYREVSADEANYDELAAFDDNIEKEGSATFLGDKRTEGSIYRKSIRGSTPKVLGQCQIEKACSESPHQFYFQLPCPHCGALQRLKWGGKDEPFGIKWQVNNKGEADPKTAYYLCEHCACVIENHQLMEIQEHPDAKWICEKTGLCTRDGIEFFNADGSEAPTPGSVAFHVWTAYSPFTTWAQIVEDFYKAKVDRNSLQTFVNTTLGQPWDDDSGEKLEWEELARRREMYPDGKVPGRVVYLTAGVDTQDDRYEGRVWGWAAGQEAFLIDRFILNGKPDSQELLDKVAERLNRTYTRADGIVMPIGIVAWDSGGHYTDVVYSMSKKLGVMRVIPIRGANVYGKPIANFPRKRTSKGVYLTEVGTDNAKELIMSRLRLQPDLALPKPGAIHLPLNEAVCDDAELQQLTAERKIPVRRDGRIVYRWDAGKKRNEALDCFVYALAALYIALERFGIDLDKLAAKVVSRDEGDEPQAPAAPKPQSKSPISNGWLKTSGSGWL